MHTGERPYGNPPYATATWHRRRYEAGAAPTTTAYRWFGPWFGLTPPLAGHRDRSALGQGRDTAGDSALLSDTVLLTLYVDIGDL